MITISMTTQQAIALCHALRLSQRVTQEARDVVSNRAGADGSHVIFNEIINDLVNVRADVERKLSIIRDKKGQEQQI